MSNHDFNFNQAKNRFELDVDGQTAFIVLSQSDNTLTLMHTEVPQSLEGQGIGKEIVQKSLDYIKEHDLKFIPSCSFVAAYVKRHPEYNSLLAKE